MKTKIGNKLRGLTCGVLSQKQEAPKYEIETDRNRFQAAPKEAQLSSYFRYTVNIERRL